MKTFLPVPLGIAILLMGDGSIQADVAGPFFLRRDNRIDRFQNPPAVARAPVHIETSTNGPQARLVIPRKFLQTTLNWNFETVGKAVLPWGAALALGMVLVPVGLGKGNRLAATLGLVLGLTATFFLTQNSRAHTIPPSIQPFKLTGQVTVEVVEEGDAIRLIFNKNKGITTQYGS